MSCIVTTVAVPAGGRMAALEMFVFGAADRNRTGDRRTGNPLLCQLSYRREWRFRQDLNLQQSG